jgi:transposase
MNQEIKQLSEQIMNSVPLGTERTTREKLNELIGWLVGYVAGNQQIPAEQQFLILRKVRETQF